MYMYTIAVAGGIRMGSIRTGSGPVIVQFIASGRIWMHREFVIARDYAL